MTKTFFHYKGTDSNLWANEPREFARLPVVGEYVARDAASVWFEVKVAIHCPFQSDYEAEVYAVPIDRHEVLSQASASQLCNAKCRVCGGGCQRESGHRLDLNLIVAKTIINIDSHFQSNSLVFRLKSSNCETMTI